MDQHVVAGRALGAGPWAGISVGILVLVVVSVAALWRVFTKAGRPGWAAAVPLYHWYVLVKVVGRPGWWTALLLIPLVNLIVWLRLAQDLDRSFGKTTAFAVLGLWLFPLVGHAILGFGNARYRGPSAAGQERRPVASDRG